MNRLTNTEADEAIAASFDAYDDRDLDRPSRADLEEDDPHSWPEEARGPLLDALDRAIDKAREARRDEWTPEREARVLEVVRGALCDVCQRNEAGDHGLCKACATALRCDS